MKARLLILIIISFNIIGFIIPMQSKIPIAWTTNGVAICTAFEDQEFVQIVSDGQGGAIISWEDWRYGNASIYVQRINANGSIQWTIDGVLICDDTVCELSSYLDSDGSGGAFIIWEDTRNWDNSGGDIYAQRIRSNGTTAWKLNGIEICTAESYQMMPRLISDEDGGIITTWCDYRNGNVPDIYAQRINSDGNFQWTPNGTEVCIESNEQLSPQLLGDTIGGAIITWQDNRSGEGNDIYAQRLDSNGNFIWTTNGIAICNATYMQSLPMIVNDGQGGAIITWEDQRYSSTDIYAQKIDLNGNSYWTINGIVISNASAEQQNPSLVSDGLGGAIIAWEDYRNYGNTDCDIFAQKINSNGTIQWDLNGIAICTYEHTQHGQKLAYDGIGGAVIAWEDQRGIESDVYAQWVASNGSVQWNVDGYKVCDANNFQSGQQIASNGTGSVILAWEDMRDTSSTGTDIYAQKMIFRGNFPSSTGDNNSSDLKGISFTHYYFLFSLLSIISLVTIYKRKLGKSNNFE